MSLAEIPSRELMDELGRRFPDGIIAVGLNPAVSIKGRACPVVVFARLPSIEKLATILGFTNLWATHQAGSLFAEDEHGQEDPEDASEAAP